MPESQNKSIESYPSDVIILNLAFYDQSITLHCAVRIVDTPLESQQMTYGALTIVTLMGCLSRRNAV
jgi:hypothetical protein